MVQSKAYESNADQWPGYPDFEVLDDTEIRLLRLDKTDPSRLRYTLHHEKLNDALKYCALSYSWGAPVPSHALKEIFIHGKSVLIRPTLYSFLKAIKHHNLGIGLWLDAICIDQRNEIERSHQVSMMRDIFEKAQEVFVWLGRGDDDINYVIEHIQGSEPETRFDQETFSIGAEKLFRASYWTRRWVIQEFALAKALTIFYGKRRTKWTNLMEINVKGSEKSDYIQLTLEKFQGLRLLTEEPKSLFELMQKFRDTRCIDIRDKAFALRGIAQDGGNLLPSYSESIVDVYFRILSILPTERILPQMSGYRWPHQAASRLQSDMQLTGQDLLSSLVCNKDHQDCQSVRYKDDHLYTVLEFTGVIIQEAQEETIRPTINPAYLVPLEVQLQGSITGILYSTSTLTRGDLVYSLQSTPQSPRGIYIALSATDLAVVGMLINHTDLEGESYWTKMGLGPKEMKLIETITLHGVKGCTRNFSGRSLQDRVLCHINRLALILFWLLDIRQVNHLLDSEEGRCDQLVGADLQCHCPRNEELEILPSFLSPENGGLWAAATTAPWSDTRSQESPQCPWWKPRPLDFLSHGRIELSYAAGYGHMAFTKLLVDKSAGLEVEDEFGQTPLSWAARGGHEAVVKLLLGEMGAELEVKDKRGRTPLSWAAGGGHEAVVKLLLVEMGAELEAKDKSGRTPLSWAAGGGHEAVVKLLVEMGADLEAKEDFGRTPLSRAAGGGHEAAVKLLVEMGADLEAKNQFGETPLSWAAGGGYEAVVNLLVEMGAKCRDPDPRPASPLFVVREGEGVETRYRLDGSGAE